MAASARELITIQAGHYSNFVATHWWNIQEGSFDYENCGATDVNHDVLFREGITLQGEQTYLPRSVIIDLKGSTDTLNSEDVLYKSYGKARDIAWKGNVSVHKEEATNRNDFLKDLDKEYCEDDLQNINSGVSLRNDLEDLACGGNDRTVTSTTAAESSKFYNLDSNVMVWSDFLRMHVHPRSMYIINEFCHDSDVSVFDSYDIGVELWSKQKTSECIEEKIRYFSEECDFLQGFQVLMDGNNGFSGVGSEIISYLQEEYPRKQVLAFPVYPTVCNNSKNTQHDCFHNTSFLLDRLSLASSLVVPLSLKSSYGCEFQECRRFPYLSYNPSLAYHSAAILASALEAITLPFRVKENPLHLQEIVNGFVGHGMKITSGSLGFPFYEQQDNLGELFSDLENRPFFMKSLSPGISLPKEISMFQTFGMKGLKDIPISCLSQAGARHQKYQNCKSVEEIIGTYFSTVSPSSFSTGKAVKEYCSVAAPFPNVFQSCVASNGSVTQKERALNAGVLQVPILGSLQCHSGIGDMIKNLCEMIVKTRRVKPRLKSGNFTDPSEFEEMMENLRSLSLNYAPNENKVF